MGKSIAVVYLARSEFGSAKDFSRFALSYRKFKAGVPHELIIIHKGAATKAGAREAIAMLFDGIEYSSFDRDDNGFDIQAYLAVAPQLSHDYVCFLNTYSEICADDWLAKLLQPLLDSPTVGMAGATASYESLHSSVGLYSKVIWMCSGGHIGYDHRIATAFAPQLSLHVPQWLNARPAQPEVAARTFVELDTPAIRDGFAAHWRAVTKVGGGLWGLDQFKPFPNPHLRSNAFVMRREFFNNLGFQLGDSKMDCVRFESGLDGLPTRIAQRGLASVLVGADGQTYATEKWTESNGFRLGDQTNVMVTDNQVRAFSVAGKEERRQLTRLSWGAYADFPAALLSQLGFPHARGNLQLSHTARTRPGATDRPLLISIVIPTRNRTALVKDALYSVIGQDYPHWECIVFDNNSDEPLEAEVAAFNDERIRYVRSDRFLPVTDSWNGAIDEARGDYITLLGDDDGLTPNFMSSVEFITRHQEGPDFIYTSLYQFFHPGVAPWEPAGYVVDLRYGEFFEGRDDIFKVDPGAAQHAVNGSLGFKRNFAYNMQAFCFSKPFLDSIRMDGKVFHSPFPDYYLANVAMGFGKVITAAPKPLAIAGVSKKSFGFTLFNRLETQGAAMLATDLPADPMYEAFQEQVLPGPSYNTNFLITMHHVRARLGTFALGEVDVGRYRRLQILSTLFPEPEGPAEPLPADFRAKLDGTELKWADEVTTLAALAGDGDADAVTELAQLRRNVAMHGKDATVKEIDIGSFARLPELFEAIRRQEIQPARAA